MCKCLAGNVACCCFNCALSMLISIISAFFVIIVIGAVIVYFVYYHKEENEHVNKIQDLAKDGFQSGFDKVKQALTPNS